MYSDWTKAARHHIDEATKNLPVSAGLRERRAALRAAAGGFHCGTFWGKKVWSRECRRYLELHGLPPRTVESISLQSRLHDRLKSGDITFPFREG